MIDLSSFERVKPTMCWRDAALEQIKAIEKAIADLAGKWPVTARVVGSHRSKSIDLPVVKITTDAGEFTLRDNFDDTNLMAVLKAPATLTLDEFFAGIQEPQTWDWYVGEIARARGYSWREWTDEEMDNPRILRVRDTRPGVDMWWEKKGEEKDRWAARLTNPAWFSRDWSSGEITCDGEFGPGASLFVQYRAYAEGIDVTTSNKQYRAGLSDFIIAMRDIPAAVTMIDRLTTAHLTARDPEAGP